jgi:putative endonuclease
MGAVSRIRTTGVELGKAGEKTAADLLRKRGYEASALGSSHAGAELDLICRRGRELVVVEVKTRTNDAFGTPFEAVDARNRRSLMAAATEYRARASWRGPIRYVLVGLTIKPGGGFISELIEDPFD